MKKLLSLFLVLTAKTAFCQTDMLAYRPLEKTIGETYILYKNHQLDAYIGFYKASDPKKQEIKYTEYTNTKIKLEKIESDKTGFFTDSLGNKFCSYIIEGHFASMVPALEIEYTRKIYLGKPVWTNEGFVPTPGTTEWISKVNVDRFKKYKVVDISIYPTSEAFIKLTLQSSNGSSLIAVGSLTATNSDYPFKPTLLRNVLFTQDPKTLYNFTPQTWANIAIYNLVPGMSKDAVRLIEGEPDEINNSGTTSKYALDQWVYPHNYIYFEGGKFKSKKYRN